MKIDRRLTVFVTLCLIVAAAAFMPFLWKRNPRGKFEVAVVTEGPFTLKVQSSAMVAPENRILIAPPVAGRIDQFFVDEGDQVKQGQRLALMSSQDRVALMESSGKLPPAAVMQMYRQIPLLAPRDGLIVARPVNEGQNVTSQDRVFELANRLVIESKVDESDIASVRMDQKVELVIDAFRGQVFTGKVIRIGHQSVVQNNINTYQVLIEPAAMEVPIRSGMSVSAYFIVVEKEKALLLPAWLAEGRQDSEVQMDVLGPENRVVSKTVRVGKSDGRNIEVISGLAIGDKVLYRPLDIPIEKNSFFGGSPKAK